MKVEEIKCFDPAMGSGHILVYMFDVLYEIYSKSGYMEREIPRLIIENNLYGLDIDDRAYQLASFSVVMKALEYNKRFLRSIEKEGLILNLASIQETNSFIQEDVEFIAGNIDILEETENFLKQFQHAKTIGSLIKVTDGDTRNLEKRMQSIQTTVSTDLFEFEKREKVLSLLPKIIKQAKIMSLNFDVLVTNPPYMGSGSMNKELADYLKKHYPDSKADLFAAFMEVDHYLVSNGFVAIINQQAWMFLSSYEKLRKKIIKNKFIDSMLHLGPRAFEEIGGEVVQSTTFVLRNNPLQNTKGIFMRLIDEKTAEGKKEKAKEASSTSNVPNYYLFNQEDFNKIPGNPIAYWISHAMLEVFKSNPTLSEIAEPRLGMATADNSKFLRFWHEVSIRNIEFMASNRKVAIESGGRWFPYNKGGGYRKWYGNNDYIVDWEEDGKRIRDFKDENGKVRSHNYNLDYIFKPGITWSALSSGSFSSRFFSKGFLFDNSGSSLFTSDINNLYKIQGFLSSKIVQFIFPLINPTLNYQPGTIGLLPIIETSNSDIDEIIIETVKENILIAKEDWDTYETSWDFKKDPLISYPYSQMRLAFSSWQEYKEDQFKLIKSNEEKINSIFIKLYRLEEDFNAEIEEKDIAIRKAELENDIKSYISYFIGCAFGRYSLDKEGLIFAGGAFDSSSYRKFLIDEDNILPILFSAYFEDDIVTKIIEFIRVTFGAETLEENLTFVAEAIGRKKNETPRESIRRYLLNDFYKDHVQVYKKRPIYWLFTSGKEKAFNCLIYMHRYDKTTLSRIRTDYLHEVQTRMDSEKKDLLNIIDGDTSAKEISNAKKELKSLDKKIDELKAYDEKLHHMADMQIEIDLDDGVAVNYAKFEGLVAKI